MNFIFKEVTFFKKYTVSMAVLAWFFLTFVTAISEIVRGPHALNNYLIFKNVFFHTLHQQNLYATYPDLYFDMNHYGVIFSVLIAPFALMPDWLGSLLWCMANAWVLYFAIMQLPISQKNKQLVLLVSLIEMLTSTHNFQFNPMVAAFIMLPFILVHKNKVWAATFFIVAGMMIKIYGVVALVVFFFTPDKIKFISWFFAWIVLLTCVPMLFSSPTFVLQSYIDWYHSIDEKNIQNTSLGIVVGQNISVHGMIQRIFNLPGLSQLWVLAPAALLNLAALFQLKKLRSISFQLRYLALCLISVTIFSSSAESSTYTIAVPGIALWFVLNDMKNKWNIAVLIFTFLFTILSPTDLYPNFIQKNFFVKYSLKSLPCLVTWLLLVYELLTNKFDNQPTTYNLAAQQN